jgi:hypothetical protein
LLIPGYPQVLGQIGDVEPSEGGGDIDIDNEYESRNGKLSAKSYITSRSYPLASSPRSLKGTGYGTEKGRPLNSNRASWKAKSIRSEGSTSVQSTIIDKIEKTLNFYPHFLQYSSRYSPLGALEEDIPNTLKPNILPSPTRGSMRGFVIYVIEWQHNN